MKLNSLLILFLLISLSVKSQTSNIVSDTDFDNIKINEASLVDIKKTRGKKAAVASILGEATSYKVDETESFYYYTFNGFKVDFSTMGRKKPYVESFEITGNQSTFTIKGLTVTVGDNISKLGNVVFSKGRNGSKSILYTVCEDCDSFVNIEFDQTTNVITKISYLDMS